MTKMMEFITAGVRLPVSGENKAVIRTFEFSGFEVGGRFRPSTATNRVMMNLTSKPAPKKAATASPKKKNRADVSPMDTMTVAEITAAESVGMDGVAGVQPSPIIYTTGPSRSFYMNGESPAERKAIENGVCCRTVMSHNDLKCTF